MNIYDLALAMTPRVGGRTAAYLIETLHSAENIFSLSYDELKYRTKINEAVAMSIIRREAFRAAEAEMKRCLKYNITPIAATDPQYPTLLREIHDPPHVIYVQGNTSVLAHNMISMVGTRNITTYGDRATNIIVEQLANKIQDLAIVSGLAFGIDGAAHRAALYNNVPTIAILPNSLPGVTPASHSQLASAIIDSGGALVTELHSTSNSAGKAYIARNRIIAGISAATIVVESGIKGGSMSTAQIANSEGRIVAAVPGRILDRASAGCNKLIAEKNAIILNSAYDLIKELKWENRTKEHREATRLDAALATKFNEIELAILNALKGGDPISITELEAATKLTTTQLGVTLMELELQGAVKAIPGARYLSLIPDGGQ